MSPKSKKYRRPNIPAATLAAQSANSAGTVQNTANEKPASKNVVTAIPAPTAQSFVRDLSWIGLTALIVVILLVIAYYVVPR